MIFRYAHGIVTSFMFEWRDGTPGPVRSVWMVPGWDWETTL
jgi:hypothetical protein